MISMRHISFQIGRQTLDRELQSGAELIVVRGDDAGTLRASVQKNGTQEIAAGLKTLSQEHARLSLRDDDHIWVEDCGSTNGTYMRVPPRTPTQVPDDGELLLGRELIVRLRPSLWGAVTAGTALPLHKPEELIAYLRSRLRDQVETVRVTSGSERLAERAPTAEQFAARLPLIDSAQQLVVQWRDGTYDADADAWLRAIVSLFNSQQSPTSGADWVFTAVSPGRLQALWLARRVAPAECLILIRGTTGSGKDVLANDIHNHSARARGPFIAVNCSAIPENLFESELFGHAKGSFTNASEAKPGLFELADGGTLFLDEIGEIPLPLQAKLLRVMEDHKVRGVGSRKEKLVDVRVVAATNRPLEKMVAEGTFREDLFYRLNTVQIQIPPLDRADVQALTRALLDRLSGTHRIVLAEQEKGALTELAGAETWRGGARELRNTLERYILLRAPGRSIGENWQATLGAGTKLPGALMSAPPSAGIPQQPPLAAARFIDNLLFLTVAKDTLERDARAGVSEIAARVGLTYQGVVNRLRNLEVKLDGNDGVAKLTARIAEERASLEPFAEWIKTLL